MMDLKGSPRAFMVSSNKSSYIPKRGNILAKAEKEPRHQELNPPGSIGVRAFHDTASELHHSA